MPFTVTGSLKQKKYSIFRINFLYYSVKLVLGFKLARFTCVSHSHQNVLSNEFAREDMVEWGTTIIKAR